MLTRIVTCVNGDKILDVYERQLQITVGNKYTRRK